jgi:hypothetical protein
MNKLIFLFVLSCLSVHSFSQKNSELITDSIDLNSMVKPIPGANCLIDKDYLIWCGSVAKHKNGVYYMFYARWPRKFGYDSWVATPEIALAKSSNAQGPYKHVKVILPARGNQFWDGCATLNPMILPYKGKYYLFYIGLSAPDEIPNPLKNRNPIWWKFRNSQRIGVAVASNPEGEWKRFDKPVLDVSKDSTAADAMLVTNPAVTVDNKGKVVLVYKQVCKNGTYRGGRVSYGVAFAKSPLGPFQKQNKLLFQTPGSEKNWMVAEDPFITFQNNRFYALTRDVVGLFTGDAGAITLFTSKDALDWKPAPSPKVLSSKIFWENGQQTDDHLERPFLYFEKGVPKFLFGAMGINKREHACNVAIPLVSVNQLINRK